MKTVWTYDLDPGPPVKLCSDAELCELKSEGRVLLAEYWYYSEKISALWNAMNSTDKLIDKTFPVFLIIGNVISEIEVSGDEDAFFLKNTSFTNAYFLFDSKQKALKYKLEND